jgi:hypothetical protein
MIAWFVRWFIFICDTFEKLSTKMWRFSENNWKSASLICLIDVMSSYAKTKQLMSLFCWNSSRSLMTIWIISCKLSFSARSKEWTQWRSKRTTSIWSSNEVISTNQLCCLSALNKLIRTKI